MDNGHNVRVRSGAFAGQRWHWMAGAGLLLTLGACADPTSGRDTMPGFGGSDGEQCVTPFGEPCEVPECDDPCGYNDPEAVRDGTCVITGAPEECVEMRGVEVSFQQQGATVPAPGGFFKPKDKMLEKWITARWQETADFVVPANVKTMLTKGGVKMWNYPDGNGWIRADFHGGIMALPPGQTPVNLLRAMANDVIKVTGNDQLAGWVGWPASNNRKVGDRVDLDIWGPDNGPIGYWKMDPDRFCVITLENKTVGAHPVNGIRCWGFVPMAINPNWTALAKNKAKWGCAGPTYMFYTIGLDSPSVAGGGGVGAGLQEGTWNALIEDLLQENDRAGGVSGRYYQQITVAQPNALKPKSGVKVKGPGNRNSHYVGLPSDGYKNGEICEDPTAAGAATGCPEGEYTCSNGQCLPGEQRCDGVAQCVDRDDEDACDEPDENGCPANQFACDDGQCIPEDWRCDGQYEDCSAGEDEASCGESEMGCKGDEFTCGDGQCIPGDWKCDAVTDCGDESDEAMCGGGDGGDGGGGGSCGANQFTCDDGQCIAESWECDDIPDCAGGEDEANCGGDGGGGGGGEPCAGFECNDGQCIAASWECDGINDCSGNEDEADCGGDGGGDGGGEACDGYSCSDGQCINASWECDGIVDCSDGGDEADCGGDGGGSSCGADEYACADGQCIPASYECDVYVDCAGGEDEASC